MEPFISVSGRAAPFTAPNVDTDVIMPKTFLKGVDRKGLDVGVFNLLRFQNGQPHPDFILNQPGFEGASFLVVGPNFGCGSSREHAVWGLKQLGIRALIGSTFAGIFDDNCRNNGVLTIKLAPEEVRDLAERVSAPETNCLTVDLAKQTILHEASGAVIGFCIEATRKEALMSGLDAISATLSHADDIRAFEARHRLANPWFYKSA
jgi:3-isopropylmalate/(R)-2-methylmalate dehydratase small subunit